MAATKAHISFWQNIFRRFSAVPSGLVGHSAAGPRLESLGYGRKSLRGCAWLVVVTLCVCAELALAQRNVEKPTPLDPVQAERQARQIVAEMLAQRPAENATNTGVLKIRKANDERREIPIRFETLTTPTNWSSVYQILPSEKPGAARLTVVHSDARNEYYLEQTGAAGSNTNKLGENELMVPFTGSDFWVSDLGLEFLRWPEQRLLSKEMRRSRFCVVLQSVNPHPGPGYARVVAWITLEAPHGIVHADAYDAKGDVIKRFDPTEFKKVEGQWQLEGMEIRNLKADTRTVIEFNLK